MLLLTSERGANRLLPLAGTEFALHDIGRIIESEVGISEDFRKSIFGFSAYVTVQGRKKNAVLCPRP